MNRKFKNILILVIGIIIGSTIGVIGSNVISANQVGYNNTKTSKTNIQDAIDELYEKVNKPENISKVWRMEGVKAIVYLDPTDLTKECNENNSVSTIETKTGCMKWYAYLEDDTSYTLLLDHNITKRSYYNYNNANSSMGERSASEIGKSYNEIGYDLKQLTTTSNWKVTPRLITSTEITNIIGDTGWATSGWFFDYTSDCKSKGCNMTDSNTLGYWTSTIYSGTSSYVYGVYGYGGYLSWNNANDPAFGLRPVITISKSILGL